MTEHTPVDPSERVPAPQLTFTPVPVRPRRDGWTVERQIAFVEKLADTNSITAACKHVGMSRESVRKLRRHPAGGDFRDACDAALDCGYADLEEAAAERAKNGVPRPIFYKGEQVGEWRHFDERLTMFLLRFRRRHRFGAGVDVPTYPPPIAYGPDEQLPFDPENEFGGCLEAGDFRDAPGGEDHDNAWTAADGPED
jgi:hypothetical protein